MQYEYRLTMSGIRTPVPGAISGTPMTKKKVTFGTSTISNATPSRYILPPKYDVGITKDRIILRKVMSISYKMDPVTMASSPITQSLYKNGIQGFYTHLVHMTPEAIRSLKGFIPDPVTGVLTYMELPYSMTARLVSLIHFYHDMSYIQREHYDMFNMDAEYYFNWLASTYDSSAPVQPWYRRIIKEQSDGIFQWKKAVRLDPKSFKSLKNAYDYQHWWREHKIKLTAYDLAHFLDRYHTPKDLDLDLAQRTWMMNVLIDIIICSQGRSILLRHRDQLGVREFYYEFEVTMSQSMSSEFRANKIINYLTSVRLAHGQFRGTHESFLLNYQEQVRNLELISGNEWPNYMKIQMLDNSLVGVQHLANVLTMDKAARKAAGNLKELTFTEAIDLLCNAAQTYDEGNQQRRRPRFSRSANIHQLDDDDNPIEEDEDDDGHEAHVHDANTHVDELLAFMNEGWSSKNNKNGNNIRKPFHSNKNGPGPEKQIEQARLPPNQWHKLSQKGKQNWGSMSEEDKRAIIASVHEADADVVEVNNHDVAESAENATSDGQDNSREVSVHDLLWPSKKGNKNDDTGTKKSITAKKSTKTKTSPKVSDHILTSDGRKVAPDHGKGVNLKAMMSQSNLSKIKFATKIHEFFPTYSDSESDDEEGRLEVCVTEQDDDMEIDHDQEEVYDEGFEVAKWFGEGGYEGQAKLGIEILEEQLRQQHRELTRGQPYDMGPGQYPDYPGTRLNRQLPMDKNPHATMAGDYSIDDSKFDPKKRVPLKDRCEVLPDGTSVSFDTEGNIFSPPSYKGQNIIELRARFTAIGDILAVKEPPTDTPMRKEESGTPDKKISPKKITNLAQVLEDIILDDEDPKRTTNAGPTEAPEQPITKPKGPNPEASIPKPLKAEDLMEDQDFIEKVHVMRKERYLFFGDDVDKEVAARWKEAFEQGRFVTKEEYLEIETDLQRVEKDLTQALSQIEQLEPIVNRAADTIVTLRTANKELNDQIGKGNEIQEDLKNQLESVKNQFESVKHINLRLNEDRTLVVADKEQIGRAHV